MNYWVIKRGDKYYTGDPLCSLREWGDKLDARRWKQRKDAENTALRILPGARIVRVVTRPLSERLVLSARLAAWEPVVAAAEEMRKRWDERASPARLQDAQVAVVYACRGLAKEHRT